MKSKYIKGFTLVELLVVITILAILFTVGFISFKNYVKDARDGGRVADISNLTNGLEISNVKLGKYPDPDKKDGQSLLQTGALSISGSIIEYSYLGVVGDSVTRQLSLTKLPTDPLTGDKYIYTKTIDGRKYQIASILENPTGYKNNLVKQANAGNDGYVAKVEGNHKDIVIQQTSSGKYITVVPSLVFDPSGSNILNQTGTLSIVNNKGNLPYSPSKSSNIGNTTTAEQLIRGVRNNNLATVATLKLPDGVTLDGSGVLNEWWIPNKNGTNWNTYSSGVILASLGAIDGVTGGADYEKLTSILNGGDSGNIIEKPSYNQEPEVPVSYDIGNSLRFNGSNAYLSRTPTVAGNRQKWTWSGWVKRGNAGSQIEIFGNSDSTFYNGLQIEFTAGNNFRIVELSSGPTTVYTELITTQVFRDFSSWYHITVAYDTTQPIDSDRVKIYINGLQVTSFSTATYPSTQNFNGYINNTSTVSIGRSGNYNGVYFGGYLSDVNFIDSGALDPKSFGQFDTNGRWIPKSYTGSYGTNGFHLDFSDPDSPGKDVSGQGNYWTPYNIGTTSGLLIHADSSIADDSGNGKSITNNGVTLNTSQSKFGGGSMYLNGSSYLTTANPDFDFGSGDFTIDYWEYRTSAVNGSSVMARDSTSIYTPFIIGDSDGLSNVYFYATSNGSTWDVASAKLMGSVSLNQWAHFAVVRKGNTFYTFKNGIQQSSWTSSASIISNSNPLSIGKVQNSYYFPGYLDDVRITKGLARWTSNFTPPTGPASVGRVDSMLDSPTNNFATLNPLDKNSNQIQSNGALMNGYPGSSNWVGSVRSTHWVSSGKWYWEIKSSGVTSYGAGVSQSNDLLTSCPGCSQYGYAYHADGQMINNSLNIGYNTTWLAGDHIIGYLLDLNNSSKNLKVYLDGNLQTNYFSLNGEYFTPFVGGTNNSYVNINFGQGGQTGLQYCADAGGYFKYCPPTGFKALSTKNITYPIENPKQYFDVLTYTGNGSTQSLTGLSFKPDLVWIKNRKFSANHRIYDSIRGAGYQLYSDSMSQQNYSSVGLSSFNNDGFSLPNPTSDIAENASLNSYVSWNWRAGGTAVTNNNGTIQSQVSVNETAGFSIVSYTGNNVSGATVGHGLTKVPNFIIWKDRDAITNWRVYHSSIGVSGGADISTNGNFGAGQVAWTTAPTSSGFTISGGNTNGNLQKHIAYVWSEVPGYSKFGSYVGNNTIDGPFIYTGFKPKYLMIKNSTTGGTNGYDWVIYDGARNKYNPVTNTLWADVSAIENNSSYSPKNGPNGNGDIDFLSNGFKIRSSASSMGGSDTYIYAAFAELPFK